jgi:hypothetical protein
MYRHVQCACRTVLGVAFFSPLPAKIARLVYVDSEREPIVPPREILGRSIPPVLLATNDEAALVLEGGVAYPQGLVLRFGARVRRSIATRDSTYFSPLFHWHWPPHPPDGGFVNVGVRYADGTTFTNTDPPGARGAFHGLSGSGSAIAGWHEFWIAPAPMDSHVEVWSQWVGAGIDETVTTIDVPVGDPVKKIWP